MLENQENKEEKRKKECENSEKWCPPTRIPFSKLEESLREELEKQLKIYYKKRKRKKEEKKARTELEKIINKVIAFNVLPKKMNECKEEIKKRKKGREKKIESWVNLKLRNEIKPEDISKKFGEKYRELPLRNREIDIIFCRKVRKRKTTPINAIEVKLFKGFAGFYRGVGQALTLLACGFDTVELWHLYLVSRRWVKESNDQKLEKEMKKHQEKFRPRIEINAGLLERLGVPIGYRGGILMLPHPDSPQKEIIFLLYKSSLPPLHNPIIFNEIPLGMRQLICEKLNIRDEAHYEHFWWDKNNSKRNPQNTENP